MAWKVVIGGSIVVSLSMAALCPSMRVNPLIISSFGVLKLEGYGIQLYSSKICLGWIAVGLQNSYGFVLGHVNPG